MFKKRFLFSSEIHLNSAAYRTMMDFARQNPQNEVIGIFFGKIKKSILEIVEAYPIRVGEQAEVDFQDEDYETSLPLIQNCAQRHLDWLGWFHSHPFKGGDRIFMSRKDQHYHFNAQQGMLHWTALVLNPHQISDPNTTQGLRAYQFMVNEKKTEITHKLKEIPVIIPSNIEL